MKEEKTVSPEDILEKHCPSMNNLYLDNQGRAFRGRILSAMKEYNDEAIRLARKEGEEKIRIILNRLSIIRDKEYESYASSVNYIKGLDDSIEEITRFFPLVNLSPKEEREE